MANFAQLINGRSYDWNQITLNIMGVPIAGITNIEYSDSQEIVDIHGAGRYVVSRGFGAYNAEAKITLLMEEVRNLISVAPAGRLQDIPEFDIIVSFADIGIAPVTHKIRNVRFKNNAVKVNTGDTSIPVELELITSHIEWA